VNRRHIKITYLLTAPEPARGHTMQNLTLVFLLVYCNHPLLPFCIFLALVYSFANQATGYTLEHIAVPVPSQDKLGGLWQEGHQA